jgi:replicative DNA helicase
MRGLFYFDYKKWTLTWHTEQHKVKDLVPCSYNPRKLSSEQKHQLTKSLQKFNLAEIPQKNGHYKCFKCNESGEVLHFIGKHYDLTNFKDILNKGIELYNIIIDNTQPYANYKADKLKQHKINETSTLSNKQPKDYTDFFNEVHKCLNETDYLTKRSISQEVQNRFKIGFVKEWKHPDHNTPPSSRIIIPTSKYSYLAPRHKR